jgi:PAS domain S-box-containing protein
MSKPVVICVDDELTVLDSLEIQLRKSLGKEYLIETASSGEEALELVEDLQRDRLEIALVIADYSMPTMQGDELLRRIHEISPKTIKIMLTGQADIEAVANAINYANLYRYIAKPWQGEDLKLTIQEAIRSYFQEKQLAEQNAQLAEYNQNLEQLVQRRTQELEEKNRQLLASEKKYRDLVETSQDMIWSVDVEGRFTFVNQAVKQIHGYEPEEMLGRPFTDFQPSEQQAKDLEVAQHILSGERYFQYETIHLAKDGKPIRLLFNAIALSDDQGNIIGGTGTASNITKRKQREEALQLIVEGIASKTGDEFFHSCVHYLAELLQVRYALVAECVAATQTQLRTLAFWTGEDFCENLEYDIADTPCQKAIEGTICYHPDGLQALFPSNRTLTALEAQSYLGIPLSNTSGTIIGLLAVLDTKPMVNESGARDVPPDYLHILKIFAARAGAELERKLAEDALKQSAYAADAANRAKSEFLSRMSHELRTPLNAILGFTQVMCRNPTLSPEEREYLGIINRSGEHLLKLINDILEMSKIESGKVTLNETSVDLYGLLDALAEMFQLKAKLKGLELIFDRTPDVPRCVKTDENKLRQVLINLLENAIKFTESGKVTLRVRVVHRSWYPYGEASYRVPSQEQPANNFRLYFEVEDTGTGIAPEEMHFLFIPFEQTATGRNSQQGTGLGLPISRQFVQLMGGDITVSSILGNGSIFNFDIPLCIAQSDEVQIPQITRRVIGLLPNQPQYRILVVDDNQLSRLLLVKLLTSTGFEVREATNGVEAIALWESWKPHLILMDMQMPVMDGYEATRQIKAREQEQWADEEMKQGLIPNFTSDRTIRKTAIVALTANAFEEDRTVILSVGCDDFAIKPFQEEILFEKIARYLRVHYLYEEPLLANSQIQCQAEEPQSNQCLEVYLGQMPTEWVTQLYQEAITGADCQIFQLIEQIPTSHEPLRHALSDWVNNFRFDRVIDLIQHSGRELG